MNDIILKLPQNVVDYIGNVLGERPFREVNGILGTIVAQANDKVLQSYALPLTPEQIKDAYEASLPQPPEGA